ncbi:DUF3347 domain-containing protein [Sphingobacterium oryzagri]|uniref:DUF3347 domain-containing protein n=1 Tax=Sphingobacterium oryzagri TaxID=3025669 RepID=A0ABY7WBV7_9SPHI|nr:DUF3347 domain-containing protein [Sphingobacterium sp. KACC 22765]WDF67128.1 DUF3347 domain-containing protein [Sphingobacterium sp. KACC 22765]
MKYVISTVLVVAVFILSACNGNSEKQNSSSTAHTDFTAQSDVATPAKPTIPSLFGQYEKLVSALSSDDDKEAVYVAQGLVKILHNVDTTSFNTEQLKVYKDNSASIEENGVHITDNLGNISHQREHLVMLGEDFYDLAKSFDLGKPVYKIACSKFNNGKGAFWLSETKEFKNPYYGAKMPGCGSVTETIAKY